MSVEGPISQQAPSPSCPSLEKETISGRFPVDQFSVLTLQSPAFNRAVSMLIISISETPVQQMTPAAFYTARTPNKNNLLATSYIQWIIPRIIARKTRSVLISHR